KSLTFTPAGTRCFLKHIYNRREYTNDFLPHNFSHFMQFLLHGKNTKQSPVYSRSVIKLFAQKIKAVPYINHAAFTEFLEKLPELVAHNFTDQDTTVALSTLSRKLHQLLYDNFLHKFEQFRTNPDDFFAALAQEITTLTHEQTLQSVEQEYLRQSLIRCLEASINKLIWSPDDQELIWESFKTIAYQLQQLTNKGIITDIDNLDDLAWSLVHRFCFFLENLGGYISPALYNRMKEDIASQAISLLNLEEQEELIMSKNEHLMQTIYEGEAKARAQLEGIY
ncbi:MAG: hypothetical protein WD449_02120, partial [Candidatus Babeliales bacterium]